MSVFQGEALSSSCTAWLGEIPDVSRCKFASVFLPKEKGKIQVTVSTLYLVLQMQSPQIATSIKSL